MKSRLPDPPELTPSDPSAPWAALGLLAVGVALWLLLPAGPSGPRASLAVWRWIVAGGAAMVAALPAVQRAGRRVAESLRAPTARNRALIGVAIALAASVYFGLTAVYQDRDFFAKTHDECSYLIQMRMLAAGHLWMPRHELGDFFDSFYLLTKPVYASMYFPGTAMMFAPALWVHGPTSMIPLLVAGAVVGLVYRLVAEWVDGAAGVLAAALLVSLSWYRMLSIMLMSQLPVLLLGLVMAWAWSRWRKDRRARWVIVIGACAGWAAVTRPVDAICFAAPVGVAVGVEMILECPKRMAATLALLIAGAAPFLALQGVINHGVTGHWMQSPFGLYAERDLPGTSYGFHDVSAGAKPESVVVQKQLLYEKWAKPFVEAHSGANLIGELWRRRAPMMADVALPARALWALAAVGLLGLRGGGRWVLFAPLPLLALGYVGYTFFLEHYAVVMAPAAALLVALGIGVLGRRWPRAGPMLVAFVIALALTNLRELNRDIHDEPFRATWLRQLHETIETNAIVLFTFDLDPADPQLVEKIAQEPVYNTGAAWPDDAGLIRAHDLGARNGELFRYYARHSPERMVYRMSRRTGQVETLGRAAALGKKE